MSYAGHSLEDSYPSTEKYSVYSKAIARESGSHEMPHVTDLEVNQVKGLVNNYILKKRNERKVNKINNSFINSFYKFL